MQGCFSCCLALLFVLVVDEGEGKLVKWIVLLAVGRWVGDRGGEFSSQPSAIPLFVIFIWKEFIKRSFISLRINDSWSAAKNMSFFLYANREWIAFSYNLILTFRVNLIQLNFEEFLQDYFFT